MICDKSLKIDNNNLCNMCTCSCNGCSSTQGYTFRLSFPKKLLVATSILVIIAMVVMPSEARTLERKIRHGRHEMLATKDMRILDRRRPTRKPTHVQLTRRPTHVQPTKETGLTKLQKNANADRFKNATRKIIKKLKNTRRFFNEEREVLNETREYRDGMPGWLPTINFVDIHFHSYKKRGVSLSERKFTYLMPKLYKSLVEFFEIFKLLIKVDVEFADDSFSSYNKTRHELMGKILLRLNSTILEIKDNMLNENVPLPQITQTRDLHELMKRVDAPQCLKNDYVAFRAYGNLLNNWYSEFRCPRGKKVILSNNRCSFYEARLQEKKDKRDKRTR